MQPEGLALAMEQSRMAPGSEHAGHARQDGETLEKRVNSSKSLAHVIT